MSLRVVVNGKERVDTNLATFILDGELWGRKPASLMKARLELLAGEGGNRESTVDLRAVPVLQHRTRMG